MGKKEIKTVQVVMKINGEDKKRKTKKGIVGYD